MRVKLFDYQAEMKANILKSFEKVGAVMCQMPTGTGKTHVLAAVVSELGRGGTVWVVAHRRELIEQIQHTWDKFRQGKRNAPEVRVMSIQWLSRNWEVAAEGERPSLIVIDEAHHALAETYQELFRRFPEAKKLGMTATPYRLSGKGFADLFDVLLQSGSIMEFIIMKRLSLFDYYSVPRDSKIRRQIALMGKRGADGDYQTREMERTLNTERHLEYLYNSLMRYAGGRRGIVYAINISHARAIAAFYADRGLRCCAIDCKTPAGERAALVEGFRRGEIDVMVNVDIFSEGFDCPEVEFIQLARPTLSLAVYLQQVGRGLRKARGKRYCVILDNVGLSHTFGSPLRNWNWEAMFRGEARNIRLDTGDRIQLLKTHGYPGKLVDEPLEEIISHQDFQTAIFYESLLRHYPDSDLSGIVLEGKEVARKRVRNVIAYKGGVVAIRLKDNTACLVDREGAELTFDSNFRDFEVLAHNILKIITATREYYYDPVTGLRFNNQPRYMTYGPMAFLLDGRSLWRRVEGFQYDYFSHNLGLNSWEGYYAKIFSVCAILSKAYIPDAIHLAREGDYAYMALLPNEISPYYFVKELPDKSIVVVNLGREYYHVNPDCRKQYLFTGQSYTTSKVELERWLSKLLHGL